MKLTESISSLHKKRTVKYLVTGAIAYTTDYSVFLALFYLLGFSAVVANSTSFITGFIVSFSLNKVWVFAGDHNKKTSHQLFVYLVLAGINLILTNILIILLLNLGIAAYLAKPAIILLIAVWNFFIYRNIIFSSKPKT